jgi:hypothetical protein
LLDAGSADAEDRANRYNLVSEPNGLGITYWGLPLTGFMTLSMLHNPWFLQLPSSSHIT